ncbi:hypothetical protein NKH53_13830 [Mesorhizobium australicum]|uniref:hypothetical protein n=1 Tax=Mesorhizobium australicum TaxID=536018 RepID=UPI00333CF24F
MKDLDLRIDLRNRLSAENRLVPGKADCEVLVGLSRDESERLVRHWQQPAMADRQERRETSDLEDRHSRARVWWQRTLQMSETPNSSRMTAEEAFESGRSAWHGRNALEDLSQHMRDFDAMIVAVPKHLHLAALNGWLNAYDDEADRLRAANR